MSFNRDSKQGKKMSIQGKQVSTKNGIAVVIEYDEEKEKFKVEYVNDQAVGWLTEAQFTLV